MVKISDDAYEELQLILRQQYGHAFAIEEVREIGNEPIAFYELLLRLDAEEEDDFSEVR